MTAEQIIQAMELLGRPLGRFTKQRSTVPGVRNITVPCILAKWTHEYPEHQQHRPSTGILIAPGKVSAVNCFSCGFHGTMLGYVSRLQSLDTHTDYSKAIEFLFENDIEDPAQWLDSPPSYKDGMGYVAPSFDEELYAVCKGRTHKTYLFNRGFEAETLRIWEAGYDKRLTLEHAETGRFSEEFLDRQRRVVFPVRSRGGRLAGAVGRSVYDDDPRYWNYWNFNAKFALFGAHLVGAVKKGIVVEGLLDTVFMHQVLRNKGLLDDYGVVGLLGSSVSAWQADELADLFDIILVMADNDVAGIKLEQSVVKALGLRMPLRKIRKGIWYDDPCSSITLENIEEVLARTISLT